MSGMLLEFAGTGPVDRAVAVEARIREEPQYDDDEEDDDDSKEDQDDEDDEGDSDGYSE